jgi:uncharacterized membrane protein YidH (DUF202 family)
MRIDDPWAESAPDLVAVTRVSGWPIWAATSLALLGIVVGALEGLNVIEPSRPLSTALYLVVLAGGTSLLGLYRWRDGHASREPTYAPSPAVARLAVVAAVLIVVACAVTGYFAATEWSEQ